jgi:hypothetical protein
MRRNSLLRYNRKKANEYPDTLLGSLQVEVGEQGGDLGGPKVEHSGFVPS